MGCSQERSENYAESKYQIEADIRKHEVSSEISSKVFIEIVYEINSKIHLEGEFMTKEKFDNFFMRNFSKNETKEYFENDYYKIGKEKYETLKLKNLLFLLAQAKKIVTRKGVFYYDKANYLFNYVKDCDSDKLDYIPRSSIGFELFIKELIEIAAVIIPKMLMETKSDQFAIYKNDKLFSISDKVDEIKSALIDKIFNYESNNDKDKLTIHNLNEIFEENVHVRFY